MKYTFSLLLPFLFLQPSFGAEDFRKLTLKIHTKGLSPKLIEASKVLLDRINSFEFKDAALRFEHCGSKNFQFFGHRRVSNKELLHIIYQANEVLGDVAPNVIDLYLHEYEQACQWCRIRRRAYTRKTIKEIFINRRWIQEATVDELANTLVHEWLHNLGFSHGTDFSSDDEDNFHSVPYAIGDIVERIKL